MSRLKTLGNRIRTSAGVRAAYDALPAGVKSVYRFSRWYPLWLHWRLSRDGYRHTRKVLAPLHDRYRGCRGVIMGNGPSLKRTDWNLLRDEYTFGLNRIYLLADEMGFDPTFYVCIKDLVLEQFADEIGDVSALKLLDWHAGHTRFKADSNTVFVPNINSLQFHDRVDLGWNRGFTVTFAAMQLAFYLGFSRIILIGVDHHFVTKGPATREIVSAGSDPNHFSPEYFGKGVRWGIPNLEGSERMFRLARDRYERAGRTIVDATDGGKLVVFPKMTLSEALERL